jgi:rubrerythrin
VQVVDAEQWLSALPRNYQKEQNVTAFGQEIFVRDGSVCFVCKTCLQDDEIIILTDPPQDSNCPNCGTKPEWLHVQPYANAKNVQRDEWGLG